MNNELKITRKTKEGVTLENKLTLKWEEFNKYFKISEQDNLKAVVVSSEVQAYLDQFDEVKKNLIRDVAYLKVAQIKNKEADLGLLQKIEDVNVGYHILIDKYDFDLETIDRMIKGAVDRRVEAIMSRQKERCKFKPQTQRLGDNPAFAKLKELVKE